MENDVGECLYVSTLQSPIGPLKIFSTTNALAAIELKGERLEGWIGRRFPGARRAPAERRHMTEDIIEPLTEICKKPMNDMIAALDRASKMTDVAALRAFVTNGVKVLDGFYRALEAILKQMKELESRQELANRLKVIIEISEQIHRLIGEELRRQSGTLFDPTTKPSP